jgi:beta-lactamase regulating signal transducer with metallopeptidase domain
MQTIPSILPANLAEAFGWMVLHSIWQSAAIAFLAAVAMILLRNQPAMLRYRVANAALLSILVAAVCTFIYYYVPTGAPAAMEMNSIAPASNTTMLPNGNQFVEPIAEQSSLLSSKTWQDYFSPHLPLIVLLWFVGMSVFLLRLMGNFAYVSYLKKHLCFSVESYWEEVLQGLMQRAGVWRSIQLMESALVQTPLLVGYLKPVILFPVGMINRLDPHEVEAILAHELAHILHHDYLLNLLQSIVEAMFYFNPAVWWLSDKIRQEREIAADDAAIRLTGDSMAYAKTLVAVQELAFERGMGAAAFAFAGHRKGQLFQRIQHVLQIKSPKNFNMEKMVGTLAVVLVLFGLGYSQSKGNFAFGQNEAQMSVTGKPSTGVWQADLKGDEVCMTFSRRFDGGSWSSSDCYAKTEFTALPMGKEGEFTMTQAAGKMTFTGKFEGDEGYGKFSFVADKSFADWVAQQGITGVDDDAMYQLFFAKTDKAYVNSLKQAGYAKITSDNLVALSIHDVTIEKINSYNQLAEKLGDRKPNIDDVVALSIHDVTPQFAQQLESIGFKNLKMDDVMAYKIHEITPDFVKYCNDMGFKNLSPDDVMSFKIHEITTEYLGDLKSAGLTNLSADDVLAMKIHGVTPETVGRFKSMGFDNISQDEILSLQVHEIGPEFLAEMTKLGFKDLSPDEAMSLKVHGISADFIQKLKEAGFENLSMDDVISCKVHSIDAAYVAELKKAGFTDLSVDEVMTCKVHNIDANYVADLKKGSFKDLSLDDVISCKVHDVSPARLKGFEQLGFKNISVEDAIALHIHDVTPDFIKKMQEKGFKDMSLEEYINLKIQYGGKLK